MAIAKQKTLFTGNTIALERPDISVEKNYFNLSHDNKLSLQFGYLYPVLNMDVAPGDRCLIKPDVLVRMAPMISPIMHNCKVRTETFFVPYRIIWDGWEKFIAPQNAGDIPPAMPYFEGVSNPTKKLGDYLGLPNVATAPVNGFPRIRALDHYAYARIFQEWYNDENTGYVVTDPIKAIDGNNSGFYTVLNDLKPRLWDKDYFTSATPEPQKGPEVVIPVTTSNVPVSVISPSIAPTVRNIVTTNPQPGVTLSTDVSAQIEGLSSSSGPLYIDPEGGLGISVEDMTAHAGGINDLRTASAVQRQLEIDSFGTRYTEVISNNWGEDVEDYRLQRPELVGSTRQNLIISEVLQTGATETESPQGNMAGHGISFSNHDGMYYHVKEHGIIMTLMSILPETGYSQGIPKPYLKLDKYDYWFPLFANLGAQTITNKEIFFDSTSDDGQDDPWGYVPRYQDGRMLYNRLSGEFRTTLKQWTLSRLFEERPGLNTDFVYCDPEETNRIWAVTTPEVDHFYAQVAFNIRVRRALPEYAVPILK